MALIREPHASVARSPVQLENFRPPERMWATGALAEGVRFELTVRMQAKYNPTPSLSDRPAALTRGHSHRASRRRTRGRLFRAALALLMPTGNSRR